MPLILHDIAIDIPTGRIAALRGGPSDAVPVLALHGWLDNAASFVPLARHLHGIDLVAIDLPGHGRSAHLPIGVAYTMEAAVHQVLDVADALGWERFVLLAHSLGAGIASLLASACPDRVQRMVCIEALGGLPELPERTAERLQRSVAGFRALRSKSLRVFDSVDAAIAARMRANALSEPVARLLVERGIRPVDGGSVWSSDSRLTVDTFMRPTDAQIEDAIAAIACPVQVVLADPAQPYAPEPMRQRYAARLRHGSVHRFDAGHHLHMEMPEAVAAVIGGFLAGTDP